MHAADAGPVIACNGQLARAVGQAELRAHALHLLYPVALLTDHGTESERERDQDHTMSTYAMYSAT